MEVLKNENVHYRSVKISLFGYVMFAPATQEKDISIFTFSGLGYIVGSKAADLMNSWRWALRV